MPTKIDLTDVILKQSTLISLYAVCYYAVFYVIKIVAERCLIKLDKTACVLNFLPLYALFILLLFFVMMLYVFQTLKERVPEEIEDQSYFLIFLFYFIFFEISSLIFTNQINDSLMILVWLNISIALFGSYFYAALKIIYFDLKVANCKEITTVLISIFFFFSLNIFGFMQAKEQGYDKNKKEECIVENKR